MAGMPSRHEGKLELFEDEDRLLAEARLFLQQTKTEN